MTRSIAELRASGVVFQADEAVAVAQQLIAGLRDPRDADEAAPPFGPPSADNVFLNDDGSVVCRGCTATLAVSEVGILLEALLPQGSPRVPGGLRYTIARALLNVDLPPFDSLDAFSRDLARHERGDRADTVRRALRRTAFRPGSGQAAPAPAPALAAPPVLSHVEGARERTLTAAAGLAAGLALIGTGELMHNRRAPIESPAVAVVQKTADRAVPGVGAERGIIAVRAFAPALSKVEGTRSAPRPSVVKRVRRPRAVAAAPARQDRGVMDRLKLGWLRRAFAVRSAL